MSPSCPSDLNDLRLILCRFNDARSVMPQSAEGAWPDLTETGDGEADDE